MKNNDRFYTSCKQVGHVEQKCINKKSQANVSSIKINSFYVLTKGINGVKVNVTPRVLALHNLTYIT